MDLSRDGEARPEEARLEVDYVWTQADERAVRRWALWRRVRVGAIPLILSVVLALLVAEAFWLLTVFVGSYLVMLSARVLIRRRPAPVEYDITLAVDLDGAHFAMVQGRSNGTANIAWADLKAIKPLRDYLMFVSGRSGIASRVVPKRAFADTPDGIARVRQLALRGGIDDD
jgi:hypothetical protein